MHAHAEPLSQYNAKALFKYAHEHLLKRIDRYADEPILDAWGRLYRWGGLKFDIKRRRHVPPLTYNDTIGIVGMFEKKTM